MMSRGRWSPMTFKEYDAPKEARMSSTKSLWLSTPKAAAGTVRKRRRTNPENMAALAKQEMQKLIHEQGPRNENISREETLRDRRRRMQQQPCLLRCTIASASAYRAVGR